MHTCSRCGEPGHNIRGCVQGRDLTPEQIAAASKAREYRQRTYAKHGSVRRAEANQYAAKNRARVNERKRSAYKQNPEIKARINEKGRQRYAVENPNVGALAALRSTKEWKEERRARLRSRKNAWRAENPQRIQDYLRKYYAANREKRSDSHRRWREMHPDRYAESQRKWRLANPDKVREKNLLRDYRSATANGRATAAQIRARAEFYGNSCSYCGGEFEHMDHAISLARGGTNWPANLRPACRKMQLE